jgi:hypothetical protein
MPPKNAAAVALGRRGGQATAKKLTRAERILSARRAAHARWAKDMDDKLADINTSLDKIEASRGAAKARSERARAKTG